MTPLNVFIGWDPREQLAFEVALFSLRPHGTITGIAAPLCLDSLPMLTRPTLTVDGKLWRPISNAPMATEFAISRFCVPFLQLDGWALFVDSDVLFLADVAELFALADDRYAVMCVKHKQESGPTVKMDGQAQTYYARKNWSSVVLWNCGHPANQRLTVEMLNTLPGRDLHRFCWLEDHEIGELPREWNHLVRVDPVEEAASAKLLHYTLGGPWLPGWQRLPLD